MPDRSKAPASQEIQSFSLPALEHTRLSNGIDLYFLHDDSLEVIKLDLFFNAGKWEESTKGCSVFTAGLLKEGTKKHNTTELNSHLESYGAFVQVSPGADHLTVHVYSLASRLEEVMNWVREVLDTSVFPEKELENFRQLQLSQYSINMEKTSYVAGRKFRELIFGADHPYGSNMEEGDMKSIDRSSILGHYGNFIKGSPFLILASGRLGNEQISLISQYLDLPVAHPVAGPGKASVVNTPDLYRETRESAVQSTIMSGKLFPGRKHPDIHKIGVVNEILGGFFGSRLMKNLREDKGFTYGIYSRVAHMAHTSYFYLSADVIKESVEEAREEVLKEMKILMTERVGESELRMVKNYMLGSLLSTLTSPFSIAQLNRVLIFHGLPADYFDHRVQAIRSITPDEITELAREYFDPESMTEVVVG